MARARNKLNTKEAAALVEPGRYSDGGGLYLAIDGTGEGRRRRWLFLFNLGARRREMGLGPYPAVSLADARKLRDAAERHLREGKDPITERDEARRAAAAKPTFGEIADAVFEAKKSEWRNQKHEDQWRHALTVLAKPLRERTVEKIDTAAVLGVLKPLWLEKPETAARLRQRIEAVIDAATAQGHRSGENPARWRGHLAHLLPKRPTLSKGHHAAMPYADVPAFVEKLRAHQAKPVAPYALEFLILTAARSGEVYGALWPEIDLESRVWTIPPSRMKAGRQHRVPLSDRSVAILEAMKKLEVNDFVFPGRSAGRLSHVAMAKVLERLDVDGATPHGFRSAFRDWAGNETHFAREVAEAALAHTVGDAAEQAYRRGDALEKRRDLMTAWAAFCEPAATDNILKFKRSGGNSAT